MSRWFRTCALLMVLAGPALAGPAAGTPQSYPYATGLVPSLDWSDTGRSDVRCVESQCWHRQAPMWPVVIWVESTTEALRRGAWHRIDLTPFLPDGDRPDGDRAAYVQLSGQLVISVGKTEENCRVDAYLREPGADVENPIFRGEARRPIGLRAPASAGVGVVDNVIEFRWETYAGGVIPARGTYPAHCKYGVRLSLQAYILE